MSKHGTMREKVATWSREARQDMRGYITDYEQLEKDVKRYFELYLGGAISSNETVKLLVKLSKVGTEE